MQSGDRILVVENEPAISRALAGQFQCDCATDGWDAISKLESGQYAAIVIDSDVPRHSGYGVLTYLREELGENLANVFVMAKHADSEQVRRKVGPRLVVVDKEDAAIEIARALDS